MVKENNILTLSKQDTSVMKGIAIIAMLCHHVYTCQPEWVEVYPLVLRTMGILGKVCVSMFLFCSGYGLSMQFEHQINRGDNIIKKIWSSLIFVIKRLVKFYSAYWFVFLIFVPITICFFGRPLSIPYGESVNMSNELLLDLLGLQGKSSYNITWWFNKLIILLYILFPIIYLFIRKTKWVGLLVALLLMRFTNRFIELNYYDLFFWQFPFVLGIGWSIYQETMKNISTYIKGKSVSLIVCVTILLVFGVLQRLYGIVPYGKLVGIRFDGFLTILILFFVIFILRNCLYVYDALVFLGKHSMNIYMTHTFLNGYWTPIHTFIQTNPVCRWCGLNMWMLLAVCLLMSIFLEFCKDKCYWDRITCVIIKYFEKK